MARFDGMHVIVTGASGGIGTAIVDRFLEEGAHVLGVGFHESASAALRKDRAGPAPRHHGVDLRDPGAIAAGMAQAASPV